MTGPLQSGNVSRRQAPAWRWLLVGMLTCLWLACTGCYLRMLSDPFYLPFPEKRLEMLQPGMTSQEVRKVLGRPTRRLSERDASGQLFEVWEYKGRYSWAPVNVSFKPDGRYAGYTRE